ncbi:MAG: hypothetical protein EOP52_00765 [Sphingobacteriales bacterium]|nr:MAG: hypothetical protein EOP52_00765 [Sphingobacteriales bacterium]
MFIKNQSFSDRDTLLEVAYDFELGERSAFLQKMVGAIDEALRTDTEYQTELSGMADDEDRDEFADEVKREFLANMLDEKFSSFEVQNRKWYGIEADGTRTLLAEVDLV